MLTTGYAYVQKSLICSEQELVVVMDWENYMTGMMVNFPFLHLLTHHHHHHHHPACGGDVLVLCVENHNQHALCKSFQLMCYQAYVVLLLLFIILLALVRATAVQHFPHSS
jgi:hypothetical protein